jgi:hypothetical protein
MTSQHGPHIRGDLSLPVCLQIPYEDRAVAAPGHHEPWFRSRTRGRRGPIPIALELEAEHAPGMATERAQEGTGCKRPDFDRPVSGAGNDPLRVEFKTVYAEVRVWHQHMRVRSSENLITYRYARRSWTPPGRHEATSARAPGETHKVSSNRMSRLTAWEQVEGPPSLTSE